VDPIITAVDMFAVGAADGKRRKKMWREEEEEEESENRFLKCNRIKSLFRVDCCSKSVPMPTTHLLSHPFNLNQKINFQLTVPN